MLAARAAGSSPDGSANSPPLGSGFLMAGSPQAGTYFPQFVAQQERLDDVLGPGAWLIAKTPVKDANETGLQAVALDDPRVRAFRAPLEEWLAKHGAEAVLVRPDRYVFGTGAPGALAQAWCNR